MQVSPFSLWQFSSGAEEAQCTSHTIPRDNGVAMPASVDDGSSSGHRSGLSSSNMLFPFTQPPPNLAMRNHVLDTGGGGLARPHAIAHCHHPFTTRTAWWSTKMKHRQEPGIALTCLPQRPLLTKRRTVIIGNSNVSPCPCPPPSPVEVLCRG